MISDKRQKNNCLTELMADPILTLSTINYIRMRLTDGDSVLKPFFVAYSHTGKSISIDKPIYLDYIYVTPYPNSVSGP